MGACQCFENGELFFGEIDTINNNTRVPRERANEQTPMKFSFDGDIPQNEKKISNYNIYQNTNKNNLNLSNKDNIFFESFSYISKSIDNSSLVDYYQMSRSVLEQINSIRINPKFYYETLNSLIATSNQYPSTKEISDIIVNTDNSVLKKISDYLSKEKKGDVILWSENVYLAISNYFIEVEEKCIVTNKPASYRVSEKLKGNYVCKEFNVEGFVSPETFVLSLLIQNVDKLEMILYENYVHGAVCCFPLKSQMKMRTTMYLVNKNLEKKILVRNALTKSADEVTALEFATKLNIKHLIEDYIDKIVYIEYEPTLAKWKVRFYLFTGEMKEEIINI